MRGKSSVEFEMKAIIGDTDLAPLLCHAQFDRDIETTDIYFDTPFGELYKSRVFVRVRDGETLQVKYTEDANDTSHTRAIEHEYQWPLSESDAEDVTTLLSCWLSVSDSANGIATGRLHSMGLEELVVIHKRRTEFSGEGLLIALDTIDGLGKFVEVEAKDESGAALVSDWFRNAGLVNLPVGYVELMLRKVNRTLYAQGRYLLPEDTD